MKLSIAIADTGALPSAFVVYRGFDECIPKAAQLGFHGVELALKRAGEVNAGRLKQLLNEHNMEVSCISTGQVYADGGLMLTHEDAGKRQKVKDVLKDLIDLAGEFGNLINIGRVRGFIGDRDRNVIESMFIDEIREICDYAEAREVTIMLEPVNRYEIDFINSVEEGVDLMKKIGRKNMMLMPDVFHMNIEDRTIGPELSRFIPYIEYIHFADSNRMAPGQGHTDFKRIFDELGKAGYDGWVSTEILPRPTPDIAAKQAAEFLLPLIRNYNSRVNKKSSI